jgi:hypothetical protein
MNAITIPYKIEDKEFWSSILGSTEFTEEWWLKIHYEDDTSWEYPGAIQVTALDGDNKPVTKRLTLDDLLVAYIFAVTREYGHCGALVDIQDMDSCASDIVLQIAMFGDVIYG